MTALLVAAAILGPIAVGAAPPPPRSIESVPAETLELLDESSPPQLTSNAAHELTAWVAPGTGRYLIDDFESTSWPDQDVWVALLDLTSTADASYIWSPSDCRSADGQRALWSIGGGAGRPPVACDEQYPAELQTSALLALDLSATYSAASLALIFDIWADASPSEGLVITYVEFDATGNAVQRRPVYSATGRSSAWTRGVSLDLTNLRDARDPSWQIDLRGRFAYLELLFVSDGSGSGGQGVFIDNLALDSRPQPPVVVTPVPSRTLIPSATPAATETPVPTVPAATPTPTDRTEACTNEPDCRSLEVRAFVDYRCDGAFQNGVDGIVRSQPRVDIEAGAELLGTNLDPRGRATFRLPISSGASVTMAVPDGFEMCDNSPNPLDMEPDDFRASGLTRVYFRVVPQGSHRAVQSIAADSQRARTRLEAGPSLPVGPAAPAQQYAVTMIDDFEDPHSPPTGNWIIEDDGEPPEYVWGRRDCHSLSGDFGFWAVGAGTRGRRLKCGDSYPAHMRSAIFLVLDLTEYADAGVLNLVWDTWANTLSDSPLGDFFSINLMRPGEDPAYMERMPVFDWTGYTGEKFMPQSLDLLRLQNRFNPGETISVAGESDVTFEFIFSAGRDSTTRPEGPTIDDIRLEHDLGPPATATPGPTASPTATRVPTRTPSDTPPPDVYLPIAQRAASGN
jgi:hypothetical protein